MATAEEIIKKSFLEWIYQQDNFDRIELYKENEEYYNGDVDIKLPANIKKYLAKEFGFTGNVCRTVVDAAVGFLSKEPLSIELKVPTGEDEETLKDDRLAAEAWVYEIFRKSKLLIKNYIKVLRIQGKKGEFALKAHRVLDDEGQVISYKISVLRPDICFPKWKDEQYEEMEYFAIKYPRNNPKTGEKEWFAQVIWPDVIREYTRPIGASDMESWKLIDEWENEYGFINIEWIQNKADDGPWAESDITSDLKDLQNAFNKTITDLVYSIDKESFSEIFLLGGKPPIDPKTGEAKKVDTGPGKMHFIPPAGDKTPSAWMREASDFAGLHDSIDKFLDVVSVVTKVPKLEMNRIGGGSVPTGVALRTIYQPFIAKTNEKGNLAKSGIENIIIKLFHMAEVDGIDTGFDFYGYVPDVHIKTGLPADEKEQAEIHEIEGRNKWKSNETIMQEIGVEDVEKEKEKIKAEMEDVYGERLRNELENLETGNEGVEL